eukprot:m.11844 g.11844  ORF g.11844 m.11844 type:complete len:791 (-) comp7855_c0_seq1:112-2484(-)
MLVGELSELEQPQDSFALITTSIDNCNNFDDSGLDRTPSPPGRMEETTNYEQETDEEEDFRTPRSSPLPASIASAPIASASGPELERLLALAIKVWECLVAQNLSTAERLVTDIAHALPYHSNAKTPKAGTAEGKHRAFLYKLCKCFRNMLQKGCSAGKIQCTFQEKFFCVKCSFYGFQIHYRKAFQICNRCKCKANRIKPKALFDAYKDNPNPENERALRDATSVEVFEWARKLVLSKHRVGQTPKSTCPMTMLPMEVVPSAPPSISQEPLPDLESNDSIYEHIIFKALSWSQLGPEQPEPYLLSETPAFLPPQQDSNLNQRDFFGSHPSGFEQHQDQYLHQDLPPEQSNHPQDFGSHPSGLGLQEAQLFQQQDLQHAQLNLHQNIPSSLQLLNDEEVEMLLQLSGLTHENVYSVQNENGCIISKFKLGPAPGQSVEEFQQIMKRLREKLNSMSIEDLSKKFPHIKFIEKGKAQEYEASLKARPPPPPCACIFLTIVLLNTPDLPKAQTKLEQVFKELTKEWETTLQANRLAPPQFRVYRYVPTTQGGFALEVVGHFLRVEQLKEQPWAGSEVKDLQRALTTSTNGFHEGAFVHVGQRIETVLRGKPRHDVDIDIDDDIDDDVEVEEDDDDAEQEAPDREYQHMDRQQLLTELMRLKGANQDLRCENTNLKAENARLLTELASRPRREASTRQTSLPIETFSPIHDPNGSCQEHGFQLRHANLLPKPWIEEGNEDNRGDPYSKDLSSVLESYPVQRRPLNDFPGIPLNDIQSIPLNEVRRQGDDEEEEK